MLLVLLQLLVVKLLLLFDDYFCKRGETMKSVLVGKRRWIEKYVFRLHAV